MESLLKKSLLMGAFVVALCSSLMAQEKERAPSAGVLGTYAFRGTAAGFQGATIKDQRYAYLQAFYLINLSRNQDFGVHASFLHNSSDTHDSAGFNLKRDKTYGIGIMHRFYNKMFVPNLELYFQSTVDFESMKRTELKTTGTELSEGLGLHLMVRPALRYYLGSSMGLELGFGALDLKTYKWWDASRSIRDESGNTTDFNMNFGLNTLMLGVFVNL